ncbi:MAG TPA: vWA domain-containing protein [Stellaceae bacterium]|nr:vWA domain-containing protein [Stellaceae bacterium]
MTVRCDETGQSWVINITANTVPRPKSAVAFVLDHSDSMSEDSGDGTTKVGKLREAASIFVNAMLDGDVLGIVRFDDTAQTLMPVTNVGVPVFGAGRIAALGHISGPELDPAGNTSIGAGVGAGKAALDAAQALGTPHYDVTAMLVLTDGEENTAPLLAAVGGSITANTFAIGLGQPENISTAALATLTQGHNGYLLITGTLTPDQSARLNKYFLQILAGVSNAEIVLDPHGVLTRGAVHRIPFQVAETEYGLDVFLLTASPWLIDFELESPSGEILSPASAAALTNVQYVQAGGMAYYRLSPPADPANAAGTRAGQWQVLLRIGGRQPGISDQRDFAAGGLPYDVVIHSYSNLNFRARATQSGFDPGAGVTVGATLTEYDVRSTTAPFAGRRSPARPQRVCPAAGRNRSGPGQFTADISGLYAVRVRAAGSTFDGTPFQREQTLSAAVYPGADNPPQTGGGTAVWYDLLRCVIASRVIDSALVERLQKAGFNVEALLKCLEVLCRGGSSGPPIEIGGVRRAHAGVFRRRARQLAVRHWRDHFPYSGAGRDHDRYRRFAAGDRPACRLGRGIRPGLGSGRAGPIARPTPPCFGAITAIG